jgi:hypothetical protein
MMNPGNPREVLMRALGLTLLLLFASLRSIDAQTQTQPAEAPPADVSPIAAPQVQPPQTEATPPPPQSARQALLEMFIAPKPGAMEKHLPEITRKILMHGGDATKSDVLRGIAGFSAGLTANQKGFESFDEGPILFAMEPVGQQERIEILVERDDLVGDVDEIEVSPRLYKEGTLQPLPVMPRLTFSMKQEKDVWTLSEIAATLRMPLADEEYLNGLKKTQDQETENMATAGVRTINTAEVTYAATYPERGFTCNLSELGGWGEAPAPEHAMLIDSQLSSGDRNGYKFSIGGCDARPAARYQVTAAPVDPDSGLRAFCADESAIVKYAADGNAATCLSGGTPLQ